MEFFPPFTLTTVCVAYLVTIDPQEEENSWDSRRTGKEKIEAVYCSCFLSEGSEMPFGGQVVEYWSTLLNMERMLDFLISYLQLFLLALFSSLLLQAWSTIERLPQEILLKRTLVRPQRPETIFVTKTRKNGHR